MLAALAGVCLSFASGWLLFAGPGRIRSADDLLWRVGLAAGAGLCLSSLSFFLIRGLDVLGPAALWSVDLALLGIAWRLRRRLWPTRAAASLDRVTERAAWLRIALQLLLLAGAGAALVQALAYFGNHPHGWWDAFAIWNLKARFLASSGTEWKRAFSEVIAWSHTDYPLLLPLTTARLWSYAGGLDPRLPGLLSVGFAALSVTTLYAAVSRWRGPAQGALAGLALLATPVFLEQSAHQVADLPLAFFLLLGLAAAGEAWRSPSSSLWVAVGLLAGAAAWTKNEGSLVLLALLASLALVARRSGRAPAWRQLAAGLLLPLAVLLAFKLLLAGESDLWAGQQPSQWLARATDPTRHAAILGSALSVLGSASGGWLLLELALLALVLGPARDAAVRPLLGAVAGTLLLVAAGYYAVYLLTPRDLTWQLETSAERLMLQLWPSLLLGIFCGLAPVGALRVRAAPPVSAAPEAAARGVGPPR